MSGRGALIQAPAPPFDARPPSSRPSPPPDPRPSSPAGHALRQSLAGPYDSHQEALDAVPAARRLAELADPWAAFYSFGTVSDAPAEAGGLVPTVFTREQIEDAARAVTAVVPACANKSRRRSNL